MTPATLRTHTCKDLAQMAKEQGVPGWHSMRKDQLIRALTKKSKANTRKAQSRRNGASKANGKSSSHTNGKPANSRIRKRITALQERLEKARNLSTPESGASETPRKDRLVVMVRDSYWLHAYWELSRSSVSRVKAAMGQYWHTAKPVLRLYEAGDNGSSASGDTLLQTIEIHGGVNNWYLHVKDPPCSYRAEIGYLGAGDQFHAMARSNVVQTPPPSARDALDENWADVAQNYDRIYAMSGGYSSEGSSDELKELLEERLRRPMGSPSDTRYGAGAEGMLDLPSDFHFDADAEMIVFGATKPSAHVTMMGEPVRLRPDGTFTVRVNMPDRRQVIPLVAASADGVEQRTIVIAVERNTKKMETVIRDVTG
jgi:hypothetical protein